jgi:hypothetical protein
MSTLKNPLLSIGIDFSKWSYEGLYPLKDGFTFPVGKYPKNQYFVQGPKLRKAGHCLLMGHRYIARHAYYDKNGAGYWYLYDIDTKELLGCYITIIETYGTKTPIVPPPPKI